MKITSYAYKSDDGRMSAKVDLRPANGSATEEAWCGSASVSIPGHEWSPDASAWKTAVPDIKLAQQKLAAALRALADKIDSP